MKSNHTSEHQVDVQSNVDMDVPEEIESILGALFRALQDRVRFRQNRNLAFKAEY